VPRDVLLARHRARFTDESHRARCRVEIGRLRKALRSLAGISATKIGLAWRRAAYATVVVLARPVEEEHADVLAFLATVSRGRVRPWRLRLGPASALCAAALDLSRQPARLQSFGQARARRWITPPVQDYDDFVTPRSSAD